MKNQKHFIACVAPRTAYIPEFDSLESTYSSNCAIGKFQAKHSIKALVTDTATETDKWRVVNIPTSLNVFDSIAVLGAVDEEEALTLAIQHKHRNFDSMNRDKCHVIETSTSALKRHLDNLSTMYVTPWGLSAEQDVLTRMKPQYDSLSPNGIGLLKTGYYSNYDSLLHEIASNDDDGLLMQPIKDIAQHVFDIGGVVPEYDAIYGAFQHLDAFMKLLYGAMESAKGNLELKNFEISKPFKRNGVAQVAVTFNLDDGQTLTIFFHNPEVTPAMLKGDSIVISWRYLLNKRDITGVIQPNQGEGISIPQIAGRMMQLANANSKRFKRTNERKAQQQQQLIDLQKSVEDKETQSQQLDAKIQALQDQLQEKAKGNGADAGAVLMQEFYNYVKSLFETNNDKDKLASLQNQSAKDENGNFFIISEGYARIVREGNVITAERSGVDNQGIQKTLQLPATLDQLLNFVEPFFLFNKISKSASFLKNYFDQKEKELSQEVIKNIALEYSNDNFFDGVDPSNENIGKFSFRFKGASDSENYRKFVYIRTDSEQNIIANNANNDGTLSTTEIIVKADMVEQQGKNLLDEYMQPYINSFENEDTATSKFSDDDVQYLKDLISGKADATNADMDKILYLAEIDETDALLNEAMDVITTALDKASA